MISRLLKIVLALIFIIILSPLLLTVAFLVLISDGRPVIFSQNRVGKNEAIFKMYKFRTMKKDTGEISKNEFKDPHLQITKLGKYLRKYSIDELPQLFNILFGNMTFIGYRPGIQSELELHNLRRKKNIFNHLPGVSGWAQVNGRDHINVQRKVALDALYYKNKSFLLDFKIISDTIYNVLSKKNILH